MRCLKNVNKHNMSSGSGTDNGVQPGFAPGPGDIMSRVTFRARPVGHGLERFDNWTKVQTLQKCLFGKVYLYNDPLTNKMAVIKKMDNSEGESKKACGNASTEGILETLRNKGDGESPVIEVGAYLYLAEVNIGNSSGRNADSAPRKCPYILEMLSYWQDPRYTYVATAFCEGGCLFSRVAASKKGLAKPIAKRYMRQLLEAVQFMHHHNIAHRDISLENILLAESTFDTIRLMDFGVAVPIFHPEDGSPITYSGTHVGKVVYRPPEMYPDMQKGKKVLPQYRADMCDLFACGMTLYFMLTGHNLWGVCRMPDKVYNFIRMNGFANLFKTRSFECFKEVMDAETVDVIAGLLKFDVEKRLSIADALKKPWFDNAQ
eukprot:GEMP01022020.1.p1 GENE.GEMP01022020.1~~GEMP01022020.1.p1  ORF type:complete len:375 (+),score=34.55 GEMP01022020.1:269-1393(+)